ncbi:MAG: exodeoxyribonuclease III [Myxococcota bacterium]|jgi:exodeoxyribonuclease-3|nr:exodeoxyribonuclease III [Deltaproteobacteria bacterium]MCP4239876.1 exodeoxyribonuclease III [bacterium]MDP6074405.1 exodeoxyribonuclease III [Myxococcota bacterium]MDP6242025.1 exodeoxyribonuclease III [Myxococcota bacterium]MDP7073791.1 exodeoxyribonuclease III [Myxococcota bacterium]
MRVATWNVNGLRARLDFVLAWLRERQPDVVGLQEIKLTDEIFPHDAFAEVGYRAATHGQKSWNGVAILARETPEVTQRGLPGHEGFGARLLAARVGELDFATVYVPNGKHLEHEDFARKLTWLEALAEQLEQGFHASRPGVICGDFNVCPSGLDSWNEAELGGAIFHTPQERQRFEALLSAGFSDLWRKLHPDRQAFSWWDYRGGAFHRKQGLRIDFLLGTPAARSALQAAEIDRGWRKKRDGLTPSDHAPVWADLA